jgi:hypothetical protein
VNAAPVYDEQKRPITAGGFVDSGPIIFLDITKQAGFAGWRHKMSVPVVVVGRGAAFGDLRNDGKIDVVINPEDGLPVLLRNVNPDHHHWVEIKLVGTARARATQHARRRI